MAQIDHGVIGGVVGAGAMRITVTIVTIANEIDCCCNVNASQKRNNTRFVAATIHCGSRHKRLWVSEKHLPEAEHPYNLPVFYYLIKKIIGQ